MADTVLLVPTVLVAKLAVPPLRLTSSLPTTPLREREAIVALVVSASLSAPAQARDLRLADALPSGSPTVEAAEYMNKVIREQTAGRQNIEIHHADRDSENFTIASVRKQPSTTTTSTSAAVPPHYSLTLFGDDKDVLRRTIHLAFALGNHPAAELRPELRVQAGGQVAVIFPRPGLVVEAELL